MSVTLRNSPLLMHGTDILTEIFQFLNMADISRLLTAGSHELRKIVSTVHMHQLSWAVPLPNRHRRAYRRVQYDGPNQLRIPASSWFTSTFGSASRFSVLSKSLYADVAPEPTIWVALGAKLRCLNLRTSFGLKALLKSRYWPSDRDMLTRAVSSIEVHSKIVTLIEMDEPSALEFTIDPWIPLSTIFPMLEELAIHHPGGALREVYQRRLLENLPRTLKRFESTLPLGEIRTLSALPSELESLTFALPLSGVVRAATLITEERIRSFPPFLTCLSTHGSIERTQDLAYFPLLRKLELSWTLLDGKALPRTLTSLTINGFTSGLTALEMIKVLPVGLLHIKMRLSMTHVDWLPPSITKAQLTGAIIPFHILPATLTSLHCSTSDSRLPNVCPPALKKIHFDDIIGPLAGLAPASFFSNLYSILTPMASVTEAFIHALPTSLRRLSVFWLIVDGTTASLHPELIQLPQNRLSKHSLLQCAKAWTAHERSQNQRRFEFRYTKTSPLACCAIPGVFSLQSSLDISGVPISSLPASLTSFHTPYSIDEDDIENLPSSLESLHNITVSLSTETVKQMIMANYPDLKPSFVCPCSITPFLGKLFKQPTRGLSCLWILDETVLEVIPRSISTLAIVVPTSIPPTTIRSFCVSSSITRLSLAHPTAWQSFLPFISHLKSLVHLTTAPNLSIPNYGLNSLPQSLTFLRLLSSEEFKGKVLLLPPPCLQSLPRTMTDIRLSHPCSITATDLQHLPPGLTYLYLNAHHLLNPLSAVLPPSLTRLVNKASTRQKIFKIPRPI